MEHGINIYRHPATGPITRIWVRGHANSAPHGQDVICAAVSALVNVTQLGLEEVAFVPHTYSLKPGSSWIEVRFGNEKSETLMNTLFLGLTCLANQYHDYIEIKEGIPDGSDF